MNMFISWSKDTSKKLAFETKKFIEDFFESKSINIYLSSDQIDTGSYWFDDIRDAIESSNLCLIILTDENEFSRWIYFESGAIAFNGKSKNIIPFLFSSRALDPSSPLRNFQYARFIETDVKRILLAIKKTGKLESVRDSEFDDRFREKFPDYSKSVHKIISESSKQVSVNDIPFGKIFPQKTETVEAGKLFVGAPMASISSDEKYIEHHIDISQIIDHIECYCPIQRVYWAGREIMSKSNFSGERFALLTDFGHLKSSEYCVFIIMNKLPTSVLCEIGYAIALNKRIVIFCKNRKTLPFLLQYSDSQIANVSVYECSNYKKILTHIKSDGSTILNPPL